MIIDIHTHIFPDFIRENRSRYFSGEPSFSLLYGNQNAKMTGAKNLVEEMDRSGIDISVVFGFPWEEIGMAAAHNDYVIKSMQRFPDRLMAFCCVNPLSQGAGKEVSRCIENGAQGIGELAFYGSGIDEAALKSLEPIMGLAREANLPVLIHTNEPIGHLYPGKTANTLKQIYDLVGKFPDNRIILAHWGGGIFFYLLLKREVKDRLKNVYFDTAASPFLYDPSIYGLSLSLAGETKVLLGTDYPLLGFERYRKDIDKSGINEEQYAAICGKNAERLLSLKKGPSL